MSELKTIQKMLDTHVPDDILIRILFEMNKYFDKELTEEIQKYQKKTNRVFNGKERKLLRKYYYYKLKKAIEECNVDSFPSIQFDSVQETDVIARSIGRLNTYDPQKILGSIMSRYQELTSDEITDNSRAWLDYYKEKTTKESKYSVIVLKLSQKEYEENGYNLSFFYKKIRLIYQALENYRHLIVVCDEKIHNKKGEDMTWDCAFRIGIFCENFMQYKDDYFPFKRDKQIGELANFIKDRTGYSQSLDLARQFYSTISYGFKYEDCFVADDSSAILLVMKKIQLDSRKVPCPSCMTTIQSGNSFPEIFLKSWECKNPTCPDRSKSGRGKRFDEFGTYRYFKMVENNPENIVDQKMYKSWKRDIFSSKENWLTMIAKYYAWAGERIGTSQVNGSKSIFSRKLEEIQFGDCELPENSVELYSKLPLVVLLKSINKHLESSTNKNVKLSKNLTIVNGDSTKHIKDLAPNQIGSAVTSPPYYNAREYSQWSTLIMYLIDMMANAKAIYNSLIESGTYLYNIGDIVSEDNVYVVSNMSKKRLQLGFLSAMFFDIVGFKVCGNIIWDKGEVQSKRNSTINLVSGYVKCINCYEHVLVLKKNYSTENHSRVERFSPVIKINCKGENTYKHTAPYPLEMVELVRPYSDKNLYVLDPFLGSGTTLKWCNINGYKGVGYELNKEYYELAKEYIYQIQLV